MSGKDIQVFDVAYFTASCDTVEKNTEFAKSLTLDYPILSDPGKKVAETYGVVHEGRAVPERWTFYIDAEGKIAHIDKKGKAGSAGADIAAKLGELKVAKK